jgi:hypothetical protein
MKIRTILHAPCRKNYRSEEQRYKRGHKSKPSNRALGVLKLHEIIDADTYA